MHDSLQIPLAYGANAQLVVHLGKYELIRRISSAGMAELYLGRHLGPEGFEKIVAVKRLKPELAERPELLRMFLSEARVAARLNHPNIAQIFELGRHGDEYFIVMEHLQGLSLASLQEEAERRGQRIPYGLAAHIIASVCRALHHAHTLRDELGNPFGLIHADVNPNNVAIGFNGDVKLGDFGVAKATNLAATTQTGVLRSQYGYMSPEQCRNEEVDWRSDIFSAGILLYELTCGRRLFVRETDFATVRAVIKDSIPPPSAIVDDVPDQLEEVILIALARDRTFRYQSAQEMQLGLEAAIRHNGWRTGPLALSRYMAEIFADRLAPAAGSARVDTGAVSHGLALGAQARGAGHADSVGGPGPSLPTSEPEPPVPRRSGTIRWGLDPSSEPDPAARAKQLQHTPPDDQASVTAPVPPEQASSSPDSASTKPSLGEGASAFEFLVPDSSLEGPTIIQPPSFDDIVDERGDRRLPEGSATPDGARKEASPLATSRPTSISASFPKVSRARNGGGGSRASADAPQQRHGGWPAGERRPSQNGQARLGSQPDAQQLRVWLIWGGALMLALAATGATVGLMLGRRARHSGETLVKVASMPPGAKVFFDGMEQPETTPLTLRGVEPERQHWLVVTKQGYRTATRRFQTEAGGHVEVIIPLHPLRTEGSASVQVTVDPAGAAVYVDGSLEGTAPLFLSHLRSGVEHALVIKKPGYKDATLVLDDLKRGQRHLIEIKLEPLSNQSADSGILGAIRQ